MEKSWKMEIYHKKVTFWPNAKCDVSGNILMHAWRALFMRKVGYLKVMEFFHFIMEKSWKNHEI